MQLVTKPIPSEDFFKLSARKATAVAGRVAKDAGGGKMDWQIFREWTQAWQRRNRTRNLTLV